jgi:hypothetical protein
MNLRRRLGRPSVGVGVGVGVGWDMGDDSSIPGSSRNTTSSQLSLRDFNFKANKTGESL